MKLNDLTPGVYVQHRNGLRGTVDDCDARGFSVVWDNAGRVEYPARLAKDFKRVAR